MSDFTKVLVNQKVVLEATPMTENTKDAVFVDQVPGWKVTQGETLVNILPSEDGLFCDAQFLGVAGVVVVTASVVGARGEPVTTETHFLIEDPAEKDLPNKIDVKVVSEKEAADKKVALSKKKAEKKLADTKKTADEEVATAKKKADEQVETATAKKKADEQVETAAAKKKADEQVETATAKKKADEQVKAAKEKVAAEKKAAEKAK